MYVKPSEVVGVPWCGKPKNHKGPTRKKQSNQKSPFHEIEYELYKEFVHWRKKGIKVSASRIPIIALKICDAKKLAGDQHC